MCVGMGIDMCIDLCILCIGGDFIGGDEVPASLRPLFERQFSEQLPFLAELRRQIDNYLDNNKTEKESNLDRMFHRVPVECIDRSNVPSSLLPMICWAI